MNKILFEEQFNKSTGKPFIYNGREIVLSDKINLKESNLSIKLSFLHTDSKWRQGIVIDTLGELVVNECIFSNKIVLWENTSPKIVELQIKSKNKIMYIYNVWDTGDGVMQYGHNGSGMYIENINNTKIYHCNDGEPDDDLNDLIFQIEFV